MHQFHSYVPQDSTQGETVFNRVGVVGDQLSVERAVNCTSSLANGFTPEERLEGLHVEIADWHAELKFLAVSFFVPYNSNIFSLYICINASGFSM